MILGLDPGQSGGWALLGDGEPQFGKWPATEADTWVLFESFPAEAFAVLELAHSMPKDGVRSAFAFGQHYGTLRAFLVARGIPFEAVAPTRWQREFGLLGRGAKGTEKKNLTKSRAQELFPSLRLTHATADALLLAEWGRRMKRAA